MFKEFDFATAAKHIQFSGYDGVEISTIQGMCEHLPLDDWKPKAAELRDIVSSLGIEYLSMEFGAVKDEERLIRAFEAGAEIGIPVVNIGPGGKTGVEEDFARSVDMLNRMSEKAEQFGVTLCVKAHIGNAIHDTPTTLRAMELVKSSAFGIDMDPSHIYRAGELPEEALPAVLSKVKHVHIRDCKGREQGPGSIEMQACGRGDIDLYAYCKAMVDGKFNGPVCLEVIGAKPEHSLAQISIIAAETYGYLNACLKKLGAR